MNNSVARKVKGSGSSVSMRSRPYFADIRLFFVEIPFMYVQDCRCEEGKGKRGIPSSFCQIGVMIIMMYKDELN